MRYLQHIWRANFCTFSIPNLQEVLFHHLIFLRISSPFFFFFYLPPLYISPFFFSPLLSVVPFSFLFSFFYVSCFFCICFPFNNPPYSFLHFLRSLSVYVPYRCIFVLCTSSFFLLPAFFYSQRLTVASHIARIFCIFCPHTAVCVGEDPQDISSLVLFPSSLFSFST